MATKADRDNERRLAILGELMKEPANKECADCSAKGPRWASWSLGVFLCINCAGIHRSLGTHISKVKSATLDKWTEEQVENMQNMGNARAKEIYEANVPAHYPIPTAGANAHELENWIKAKYERKEFMQRGARVPTVASTPSPSRERREREHDREKRRAEREKRRAERERRRELEERERSRSPAPQVAPPPHAVTTAIPAAHPPAPAKQSTNLNELLGFGEPTTTTTTPTATVNTASAPDKASIMSLYATPIQPSHPMAGMHTTTNHMRMPPNYNISLGATTPYVAPTPYVLNTPGYGYPSMGYQTGGYAPSPLYNTPLSTGITVPMGYGGQVRLN